MRIVTLGISTCLLIATPLTAQVPSAPTSPAMLVKSLERFVGTWTPAQPPAPESPRAQYHAERYAVGPNGKIVWFTQGVHRTDPSRNAVPGFLYWHPGEKRYRYQGFNTLGHMLFEGYLGEITKDSYELFYTVTYPDSVRGIPPGLGTNTRQFRDIHRLVDQDTMELDTWVMTESGWKEFGPAGATSRFTRVSPP